jgi:uncharacterized protein YeaO (DUF488 family)
MTRHDVRVRRVYDPVGTDDGIRVLVDRIWPRGVRKDAAALDEWAKEIAPSSELRKWYGHKPDKFTEFETRYRVELRAPQRRAVVEHLRSLADSGVVTLLTATRDLELSQAAVLAKVLTENHD